MDNPEELATQGKQDEEKQNKKTTQCVGHHYAQTITANINKTRALLGGKEEQKHNTICVGHHYTRTNTNNVNKTRALLQTTGGKHEPNIVLCGNRSEHHNTILHYTIL